MLSRNHLQVAFPENSRCFLNQINPQHDVNLYEESKNNATDINGTPMKGSGRALQSLLMLLVCLANVDSDGRIIVAKREEGVEESMDTIDLNYVLLNPSTHFKSIIERARSVVLIGGTMQPFSYSRTFLFPDLPDSRLRLFSCGHVVRASNISAHIVSRGIDGTELDFRHRSRLSDSVVQSLKGTVRYCFTSLNRTHYPF